MGAVESLIANPLVHIYVQRFGGRLHFGIGVKRSRRGGLWFVGGVQRHCRGQKGHGKISSDSHWHCKRLRSGKGVNPLGGILWHLAPLPPEFYERIAVRLWFWSLGQDALSRSCHRC